MDFFFTTGQVAKPPKVTDQTIRNLCQKGLITASRSAGGHYRIAPTELERLKALESLPAVPRATLTVASGNGTNRGKNELLAPPSDEVVESAEEAFIADRELARDSNSLQRLRVRKEAVELQDFFEDREARRLAREIEEDRREDELAERRRQERGAELAAEERRRFEILQAHWDVPIEDVDLDR